MKRRDPQSTVNGVWPWPRQAAALIEVEVGSGESASWKCGDNYDIGIADFGEVGVLGESKQSADGFE